MTKQEKAKAKYIRRMETIKRTRGPKSKRNPHVFIHAPVGPAIITKAMCDAFDEQRKIEREARSKRGVDK